jgi:glycosyltransferase involved in cell wall biosynthesis
MQKKNKTNNSITMVIPIFNEVNSIDALHKNIIKLNKISKNKITYILVNDGSTDKTRQKLKHLSKYKNVILINKDQNEGYGAALKTGIKYVKTSDIVITDCDSTYPFDKIDLHYKIFKKNKLNLLIGDRTKHILSSKNNLFNLKLYGRTIIKYFSMLLTGKKINDLNSGYRFFKKENILKYLYIFPDGFSFSSTNTIINVILNYKKVEWVPIKYFKRVGKSKIKPISDFTNFLKIIFATTLFLKPLRIFFPIFLFSFSIGLILIILRIFFIKKFLFSGVILILISINFLFFGYLFDFLTRTKN